ncbi:homoprotocatechuate degradation operon regulator HpaR [Pseudomonas sp. 3-2]|jgi:homoprotocatechuate degradation regulator HpaR|uniref:homoprotocatechuate degradation operon regulator HpaR n=1 Tax=Pseudomonas sp. 3-2 TaxID=2867408 RepID=UPI001C87B5B9|nr:homoprotocatechuate degradation operon regulator HpaR [Pseudomonas sp. 3-2]QZD73327.1 homoprotocatechuate degradation operon regulator HpaR [Pseudomonas sp. 3-2]
MPKPNELLTLKLSHARESVMRYFRPSLNHHGLTEQQWRVIRVLHEHGDLEINKLAMFCCIVKPSLSTVLTRMESAGFVSRQKVELDKRRVLVRLHPKGRDIFEALAYDMERNHQRLQERYGQEKWQRLIVLLDDLNKV